jgi:hypothetical protein
MYWIFLNAKGVSTGKIWQNLDKPEIDFSKMLVSHGFED